MYFPSAYEQRTSQAPSSKPRNDHMGSRHRRLKEGAWEQPLPKICKREHDFSLARDKWVVRQKLFITHVI